MLRSQFTYYVIILGGGGGVRAMIILITQGGVGGPEMGKTWLRNMCTLPYQPWSQSQWAWPQTENIHIEVESQEIML